MAIKCPIKLSAANKRAYVRRTAILEMSFASANQLLKKKIIRSMAIRLGIGKCFRCGLDISLDEFSIEHKQAWLYAEDKKDAFFNLDNIAFSHLTCNIRAARKPNKIHASKAASSVAYRKKLQIDPVRRAHRNAVNRKRIAASKAKSGAENARNTY